MLIDTEYAHLIFKSFIFEKVLWLESRLLKNCLFTFNLNLVLGFAICAWCTLAENVIDRQTEFASCLPIQFRGERIEFFSQDHSQSFVLAETAVLNRLTFKHLSKLCVCTLASDKRECVCRSKVLFEGVLITRVQKPQIGWPCQCKCLKHTDAKQTKCQSLDQRKFIARPGQKTGGLCLKMAQTPQRILKHF